MVYNYNNNQNEVEVEDGGYDYSNYYGYQDNTPISIPSCPPCNTCIDPCAPDCCRQIQFAGVGLAVLFISAIVLLIIVISAQLSNSLATGAPPPNPFGTLVILAGVIAVGWFGIPLGLASPFSAAIDGVVEIGKSCCPCPEARPGELCNSDRICFEEYLLSLVWIAIQVASTWVLALAWYVAIIIYLMFVPTVGVAK